MCASETEVPPRDGPGTLTVFFDGSCPVCRREIDHYRRYADVRGLPLRWTDVAADPDTLGRRGVSPEAQRRKLHAITPDGRLLTGIDAFAGVWRRMPRYRWLADLLRVPAARAAARFAYDRMAVPALARWNTRRRRRESSVDLPHDDQN